jgi:hypothetical protein
MATIDDLQKQHESALAPTLSELAGRGGDSDWALVRALVHRAVHIAAERKAGEFCAVATLLSEMITHAHELLHPGDDAAPAHSRFQH